MVEIKIKTETTGLGAKPWMYGAVRYTSGILSLLLAFVLQRIYSEFAANLKAYGSESESILQ